VTVFLRVLEPSVDEKEDALLSSIRALRTASADSATFDVSPEAFQTVPGSPFAYWASETIRSVFVTNAPFEADGRTVKQGLATADDFRFVRAWWEVAEAQCGSRWFPFAKGGAFSRFYSDVYLVVDWEDGGKSCKAYIVERYPYLNGNADYVAKNTGEYFRPGLTWPRRTTSGFGVRAMPLGCVFADKGPAAFVENDAAEQLLALSSILNSLAFAYLVGVQVAAADAAARSYEVGLIQQTPIPHLVPDAVRRLSALARRAWSLKRTLDTTNETSHAFVLPGGVRSKVGAIDVPAIERELADIQREIDELVFELYGLGAEDRATIEASTKRATPSSEDDASSDDGVDADDEAAVGEGSDALRSWLVGVAFGRCDPRRATGERPIPPEPEPFDPLPTRSPGMYPEGEEPTDRPDILVDDEGHPEDLAARALAVAERVKVDAPENLRAWLAREFFPLHIKMYSKSRRKAPIYWQLATPSASYSVWLYIHAFSKDTLFRVQNDYVAPKLAHEERRLESLTAELRDGATATQRKQLAAQEAFVEELRTFLDEVKRVAPLWNPNLDDGVIINFAPLWRLVPQNKAWQKELKSTWDALCEGKYDWAHLAMHLWPERVVPKCAKDRSLAIAHGLEDVFWVEGTDGKWTARKTPTRSIEELVRERTSPAVKEALKTLIEAPVSAGTRNRRRAI
jgi:hypothetical protein